MTPSATILHASAVAFDRRAVLILGPSGAGKSSLALALMALGCVLVSDDRTELRRVGDRLVAAPPATLAGRIEARGVGILAADHLASATIALAVDLGLTETDRLPQFRQFERLGVAVPLVLGAPSAHFPTAVLQCLKGGRVA